MESVVNLIQSMLAPGIMISACGLLLLGMNNKYSLVVNRIRLLNDERRRIFAEITNEKKLKKNHKSIGIQIKKLSYRVILIRNAVFSYSVAVGFFIVASLLIGLNQMVKGSGFSWGVIIVFLIGMIFVFAGVIFAAIETWKGYKIIKIEMEDFS